MIVTKVAWEMRKTIQLLPWMIEKFIDIHRLSEDRDFTWVLQLQTEQTEVNLRIWQIEGRQREDQKKLDTNVPFEL